MKKAEAISILATSIRPREAKDRARYDEAVKMAIEALKSSEQTAESAQNVQDGNLNWAIPSVLSNLVPVDVVAGILQNQLSLEESMHRITKITGIGIDDLVDLLAQGYELKAPSAQPEQRWIPCSERLPENDNEVLITVWDAEDDYVEVYKGFYQGHEWWTQWCHGCSKIKGEPCGENIVIAWMPLPEPYKGGEE